jgi:hypothetical protein
MTTGLLSSSSGIDTPALPGNAAGALNRPAAGRVEPFSRQFVSIYHRPVCGFHR